MPATWLSWFVIFRGVRSARVRGCRAHVEVEWLAVVLMVMIGDPRPRSQSATSVEQARETRGERLSGLVIVHIARRGQGEKCLGAAVTAAFVLALGRVAADGEGERKGAESRGRRRRRRPQHGVG